MATLIAIYGNGGECLGRCDARCYDAEHPHCDCICEGMNHGAGQDQAVTQTAENAQRWLEARVYDAAEVFGRASEQLRLL